MSLASDQRAEMIGRADIIGEGGAAEGGGKPEGVAPCFHRNCKILRRFYVKDYKELKDARVLRFLKATWLLALRRSLVPDNTKCRFLITRGYPQIWFLITRGYPQFDLEI